MLRDRKSTIVAKRDESLLRKSLNDGERAVDTKNLLTINKFRKGPIHYKLWLLILDNYSDKIDTTTESIMIHLSKNASRKTISVILAELEDEKLVIRKTDIKVEI